MKTPMNCTLLFSILLWIAGPVFSFSQSVLPPLQSIRGPGSTDYAHAGIRMLDNGDQVDGYWLFEPTLPTPDSAHVIVFLHGYGAYNPMIYGKWIKHLVRNGNIVIYPRYQKNNFFPRPPKFTPNAAAGIRNALALLEKGDHIRPITEQMVYVGHSYGGVISANLAIEWNDYDLPPVAGIVMAAPGTSIFPGGRRKSYEELPPSVKIVIIQNDKERVVGNLFGKKIRKEAPQLEDFNLLMQYEDKHGLLPISADHREAYSIDIEYDSGIRNYTARRAMRVSNLNAVDYNGYWKIADALIDCVRNEQNCRFALGYTPQQLNLGNWSDGKAIRPLEVDQ
jgi:pimeloyl-ACP methyl ester carboxylesterase